jgi:hypothetical protein
MRTFSDSGNEFLLALGERFDALQRFVPTHLLSPRPLNLNRDWFFQWLRHKHFKYKEPKCSWQAKRGRNDRSSSRDVFQHIFAPRCEEQILKEESKHERNSLQSKDHAGEFVCSVVSHANWVGRWGVFHRNPRP